jgi:hypothetical protein
MGVAHHVLCGFLRRKYARADIDLLEHSIASLSRSPSSVLAKHEDQRILLEALRALAVRYQVVLELYYWEGMQTDDIAETLSARARRHPRAERQRVRGQAQADSSSPSRFIAATSPGRSPCSTKPTRSARPCTSWPGSRRPSTDRSGSTSSCANSLPIRLG